MNILKALITKIQCLRYGIEYQKDLWIHPSFRAISRVNTIKMGGGTALHNLTRIDCNDKGHVIIGKGCKFNWGTQIESMNEVLIIVSIRSGILDFVAPSNVNMFVIYENCSQRIKKMYHLTNWECSGKITELYPKNSENEKEEILFSLKNFIRSLH